MEEKVPTFKFLLVGNSGVGKTSLLLKYVEDYQEAPATTVGVDLKVKMVDFRGQKLKLCIWDTAGQERFRTLTSTYYRGANAVLLVYDVSEPESFDSIQTWLEEVNLYSTNPNVVTMLVGNKIDLPESQKQIATEQGRQFAREHRMLFIETSAHTEEGVTHAFEELIQKVMDMPSAKAASGDSVNLEQNQQVNEACAC